MKSSVLLLLFVVALLVGCKKGENDPVFSLKTRKARLTGNWIAESAEWVKGDTTWVFDGTSIVRTDSITVDKHGYSISILFTTMGEYTFETVNSYSAEYIDTTLAGITCETVETGLWNFTGGAGNSKTKSQLLFLTGKTEEICSDKPVNVNTKSITGQYQGIVYNIDRLSGKELVLIYSREVATALGTVIETGEIKLNKENP
ncbi:MAG: hypothetical protein JKY42_05130 [Flavobacteriales bacterium]|nr:hypothetical protein [Flavobacteriales bacterium]